MIIDTHTHMADGGWPPQSSKDQFNNNMDKSPG
jgi:hypothetical protein